MMYQWECSCGKKADEFRKVADRNKLKKCECGKKMNRVIGGHSVSPDMEPYYDDNLESWVKSRQHRKQLMKHRGVDESFGKRWI